MYMYAWVYNLHVCSWSLRLSVVLFLNVHVYMQTLRSCSEKFPIRDYTVNVNNSMGFLLPTSIPGNTVTRKISNMDISQLQRDMMYSLNVTACSNFSCKQSNSIPFCKYILFIQTMYMYVYKYIL